MYDRKHFPISSTPTAPAQPGNGLKPRLNLVQTTQVYFVFVKPHQTKIILWNQSCTKPLSFTTQSHPNHFPLSGSTHRAINFSPPMQQPMTAMGLHRRRCFSLRQELKFKTLVHAQTENLDTTAADTCVQAQKGKKEPDVKKISYNQVPGFIGANVHCC